MSIADAAYVNQKLAFARLSLASARATSAGDDIQNRVAQHAHLDSTINHLNQALAFFLREIADQYKIKPTTLSTDPSVVFAELDLHAVIAPELEELKQLFLGNSWLQELLQASRDPTLLAKRFSVSASSAPELIPLKNISRSSEELSPIEWVQSCLSHVEVLVERLRVTLTEE